MATFKIGLSVVMDGRTAVITCVWREDPNEQERELIQQFLDEMLSSGRHPATREHDVVIGQSGKVRLLVGRLEANESVTTEELPGFRRMTAQTFIKLLQAHGYETYVLRQRPA